MLGKWLKRFWKRDDCESLQEETLSFPYVKEGVFPQEKKGLIAKYNNYCALVQDLDNMKLDLDMAFCYRKWRAMSLPKFLPLSRIKKR